MGDRSKDETIDIQSAGGTVAVVMGGSTIVSVHIRGDGTAEYKWDAKPRGGSWIQDIGPSYTGSADYDDVLETGVEQVRIRCSSGTANANDTADIYVSAGGG
jgi:hypothetical protein